MGAQKLLLPFGTTTLLGRALEAASDFSIVVVVAPALVAHVTARPNLTVIVNGAPERWRIRSQWPMRRSPIAARRWPFCSAIRRSLTPHSFGASWLLAATPTSPIPCVAASRGIR
jgi:hypothetical protein